MKNALFISSFLVAGLVLFSCSKKDPQPKTDETSFDGNFQEKANNNPTWIPYCDMTCLAGGFRVSASQHVQNNTFRFSYTPIEYINVGHGHHLNPSSIPYPYIYHSFIDNYPANTSNPIYDFEGNQIIGNAYCYRINTSGTGVPGWIGTQFATTNTGINGVATPCNMSTAIAYLNGASDKPAGSSNIICPSGESTTYDGQSSEKPKGILDVIAYIKFCNYGSGFCPISGGTQPSNPLDATVGPAIFTYVDAQTLQVEFCRSVGGTTFEIGAENNELSQKIIEGFDLPLGTTIKPQEYSVLSDGTTYGYAILELENE